MNLEKVIYKTLRMSKNTGDVVKMKLDDCVRFDILLRGNARIPWLHRGVLEKDSDRKEEVAHGAGWGTQFSVCSLRVTMFLFINFLLR